MSELVDRLTYVLRFHRPPGAPGTLGTGLTVTTQITAAGLASSLDELGGIPANLELSYQTNNDGTLFFEWGSLIVGTSNGPALHFSSIGAGQLAAVPDADGFSHGTVMYEVIGGTGMFAGAGGFITSNFLVDLETDELFDTHLGIVRL